MDERESSPDVDPDLLPLGEVTTLAAEHVDLLKRQCLRGPLPDHDERRLAAVTARLDEILPSVTAKDFEELEKIALHTQEISRRTTQRQKELGLVKGTEGAR